MWSSRLSCCEEVRDLRLRRRVKRGERLIEHERRRLGRQRARDREPLALPAAELVREGVGGGRAEPDLGEELVDPFAAALGRNEAVDHERVGEL